jgi:hypothetical protein
MYRPSFAGCFDGVSPFGDLVGGGCSGLIEGLVGGAWNETQIVQRGLNGLVLLC